MILNCQIQKKAFNEHIVLENTEININTCFGQLILLPLNVIGL